MASTPDALTLPNLAGTGPARFPDLATTMASCRLGRLRHQLQFPRAGCRTIVPALGTDSRQQSAADAKPRPAGN